MGRTGYRSGRSGPGEENRMSEWIDELASRLELDPLSGTETKRALASSREVAHRVERRITPLSTYLVGLAVGRAMSQGEERDAAFARALGTLESLLPEAPPDGG
jgi:uncharacterized protein DUF6457